MSAIGGNAENICS